MFGHLLSRRTPSSFLNCWTTFLSKTLKFFTANISPVRLYVPKWTFPDIPEPIESPIYLKIKILKIFFEITSSSFGSMTSERSSPVLIFFIQ